MADPAPPSHTMHQIQDLKTALYTNPHSLHAALGAGPAADASGAARAATLALLHASPADYEVVWTAGASAGLALVAASFPWGAGSRYAFTRDNHTSVLGVRAAALAAVGRAGSLLTRI